MNSKECNAVVIYIVFITELLDVGKSGMHAGHRQHATSAWNEHHCGDELAIYDHGGSLSFLDVAI